MAAALGVFFALLAARAAGFWTFAARSPSSVDETSLRLLCGYGLWPILLAVGLWAAAWGLGRRALRALGAAPAGARDEIAAAALGLGLLGQAIFLLGWAGGLRPAALAALVLAVAALAAGEIPRPRLFRPRLGPWNGAAAGLLAFAAAVALLTALAPPVAWDARAYHLAIPELALRAGRLAPLPWLFQAHWPHLMEVLYALPLAAGRDGAAALLHAGAAALLVAGVFLAARDAAGPAAGWSAALLLAAQPALLGEAGVAHSDAAAALFAFAAARALTRWDENKRGGWLAAAGLLAGLGAASKLTVLALLLGWTAWLAAVRRRPRAAAAFLGCGLLIVGPWLLKTFLETGDPVWPFLTRFLGPSSAAALAARNALSNRWAFPPPLEMLAQDGPGYLMIPLAGLWALSRARRARRAPEEYWLFAAAPLLLIAVFRQHAAWRYLMPLWPALALAAGRAAGACFGRKGARAAAAAVLVAAGAAPIVLASPNNALFAVLAPRPESAPGADRRALFEERTLGLRTFYRETRAALPPGARVLLFREIRGYGAGFDYLWGDPLNQDLVDYGALPDADALAARLKELGITYVLDHPGSDFYTPNPGYYDARTLALMAETLKRHARVVLDRDGLVLYQLL